MRNNELAKKTARDVVDGRIRLREALRHDHGIALSFDIIVWVIVFAAIVLLIGLGAFLIVPWAQDWFAQGDVNTVVAANETHYAMHGVNETANSRYATIGELQGNNLLPDDIHDPENPTVHIDVIDSTGVNSGFVASVISSTGNIYAASDCETTPVLVGTEDDNEGDANASHDFECEHWPTGATYTFVGN